MSSHKKLAIYWCRRDFRLNDNPALFEAIRFSILNNTAFLPLYILDDQILNNPNHNFGLPRRAFLVEVLANFMQNFNNFLVFTDEVEKIFEVISREYQITLFINSDVEPYARSRDKRVSDILSKSGGQMCSYADQLSVSPETYSGSSKPYSVFTPFRNAVLEEFVNHRVYPLAEVSKAIPPEKNNLLTYFQNNGLNILNTGKSKMEDVGYLSKIILPHSPILKLTPQLSIQIPQQPSLEILNQTWYFEENKALNHCKSFIQHNLLEYKVERDNLSGDTIEKGLTSRLSPALKWGLISPRLIMKEIIASYGIESIRSNENIFSYVSELLWREFYRYILWHNPEVLNLEFQMKFRDKQIWVENELALGRFKAWIECKTVYPIVDAAMNQIRTIGWMHNRTRMVVASVLTKNLGVDWRWGQEYFRYMLVDLDEASNNGGWQWAASVGSDPKPMRIFNPYLQAENYDPESLYQKRWLPQDFDFFQAPIIEHSLARQQALSRYSS